MVARSALLAAALACVPAGAQACRLALVLAIDVSSSVDAREDALQRGGLARALQAPEVVDAFFAGSEPVALAAFEWSGRYNQAILLDWTLIRSPDGLADAANQIARSTRSQTEFPTSLGYALGFASTLLARAPSCLFQTVDVAGDGENNDGFGPAEAYIAFPFDGVTVNGLVVNGADFEGEMMLVPYYENQVIRGPGAFVEVANGFEDYENAMRRKLLRELSVMAIGGIPTPSDPSG